MSPSDPDDAREALCTWSRRMVRDGLVVGTSGNLSLRCGELIAVTPSGVDYETMTPADVVLVSPEGTVVDGVRAPTSELALHLAAQARPGTSAVVHTHSPAAVALSLLRDHVPPVHYQIAMFGGTVRVADYAPFGSDELVANAVAALGDGSAVVLGNHGTLVLGEHLGAAYDGARQLEWLCDVWLRARTAGEPRLLSEAEISEAMRRFAAQKRTVRDSTPGSR
ncbi:MULTISPECIES: class II aldolase/adducin family protein [Pseudonocardia]|uniref:L-fuculose phosphate aldolase n=2 Tax=Pseudonocardia TaxID=1847 RepID=A0A1Y2N7S7_PSEAH|nr:MULTISPECIES: class II aldolase/adducin family protein [Pseudonocardia]OSY43251.1 L-fuculose phosphate aldolase [Pseudonocardia autotrophica]TDN71739.1 L-fuculose 1-phosphate aldolase [Pseudonocardia autotrophica]BBG02426.1 fuculose phosphate aldolase [Pseudonocardia autotrophica]GEC23238.1 fuculose phosphate aldolase [Pseudonocardia saturnea]